MPIHYIIRGFDILQNKGPRALKAEVRKRGKNIIEEELLNPTIQWWKYGRHYETKLNPRQHLWVDPNKIFLASYVPVDEASWDITHVLGGNWDRRKLSFEDHSFRHQANIDTNVLYQSMYDHFKEQTDWKCTNLYNKVIHGDMYWRGIQSETEFEERCEYIDQLYDDMQENGYQTYKDLHDREPERPREIQVMIGRDGTLFFVNGKHRLSIAKILNLDEVAVNVTVRHKYWQELRDRLCNIRPCEKYEELYTHPDLQGSFE